MCALIVLVAAAALLSACDHTEISWHPAAHTTPSKSPKASSSAKPKAKADQTFTLSAVGDTIVASAPHYLPPNGGAGIFASLHTSLQSDLQMANLEEPVTDVTNSPKCGADAKNCFAFRAPTSYAKVLAQGGFDLVNLANNHALDYGTTGHAQTESSLTAAGVTFTGPPGVIPVVTVKGIRVAVLGFAPYSWANNLLNIRAAQKLVSRAAAMADVVIVQAHMGGEGAGYQHVKPGAQYFLGENRGDAIAFTHAMIDAGADIVIGHGPHVLRGMEFYKGHLIAYSLGNFVGYHALKSTGAESISMILRVTLRANGSFVRAAIVAVSMVPPGLPQPAPAGRALTDVRALTGTDFPATGAQISTDGA
ncbi:MAG TPA: CapA family protein, partial [Micromonosporaceae bacterium]